jgi:hypothetical protein
MYAGRFRKGSESRALMASASLVCRVDGASDDSGQESLLATTHFWHIAHVSWSPLWVTVVQLTLVDEDFDSGRVILESTETTHSELEALATLTRELVWEGSWYEIESSTRPTSELNPMRVAATPLKDGGPFKLWPLPERLARLSRPRRGGMPSPSGDDGPAEDEGRSPSDHGSDIGDLEAELEELLDNADAEGGDVAARLDHLCEEFQSSFDEPVQAVGTASGGEKDDTLAEVDPMLYEPTSPRSEASQLELDQETLPEEDELPSEVPASTLPHDREPADVVLPVLGAGSITYYQKTNRFVAHCIWPGHGASCFKTRTSLGRRGASGDGGAQGRPLGHLAAWLLEGEHFADKASHFPLGPDADARARGRLVLDTVPGSEPLFLAERPVRPGEPNEPVDLA